MLPPRRRVTADVAVMLLDLSDDLTDVINRAHFGGCRLRGYGQGVGRSWPVCIGKLCGPYNIAQHYRACM